MLSFMDESRSSQRKRARSQDSSAMFSPIPCKRPLFVSTPRGTSTVVTRSKEKDSVSERSFEVDITGSTARHSSSPGTSLGNSLAQHTTSLERAVSLNPSFASLKGNPMEAMEDPEDESTFSSVEGSCDSVACDMSSQYDTEDELREEELLLEGLFHSLDIWHKSCKLTAKLTASYDVFITQILLAALDHNFHLFRDDMKDSTGQLRY